MPFTPAQTLIGASMMSMAAYHVLILNGGVLGVSGFVHRMISWLGFKARRLFVTHISNGDISSHENPDPERLASLSVVGLVVGGVALGLFRPTLERQLQAQTVDIYNTSASTAQAAALALAGLLVGLGSKLSNGCTSGHMLCGVSRLAPRSLVATMIFFPVGVLTHLLLRELSPFTLDLAPEQPIGRPSWSLILLLQLPMLVYRSGAAFLSGLVGKRWASRLAAFHTSLHFALGIVLSGMLRPSKIFGFMNLTPSLIRNGSWDPSLGLIIVAGILPQLLIWQISLGKHVRRSDTQPAFANKWSVPMPGPQWRDGIDARLIVGAALFGVGWGMCAICPGPALVLLGAGLTGGDQMQVWSRTGVWTIGFISGRLLAGS